MMRTSSVATGLHDKDKVSWIEEVRGSKGTRNIYGKNLGDSRNWFSVVASNLRWHDCKIGGRRNDDASGRG